MSVTMEVTGFPELEHAWREFPKKFVNKSIKKTLKEVTKDVVVRDAQRNAPVGATKQLKRSIRVRTAKGRKGKRLPRGTVGFAATSVKTKTIDAYYSGWVFLGAKNRDGTKRPGTRTLRNALYGNSEWIRQLTFKGMKEDLPRIAREVKIESLRFKVPKSMRR